MQQIQLVLRLCSILLSPVTRSLLLRLYLSCRISVCWCCICAEWNNT